MTKTLSFKKKEGNSKCEIQTYHLPSQYDKYYLITLIKPLTLKELRKDFACWRFQHRNNRALYRIFPLRT